jgi:hypothetical protein
MSPKTMALSRRGSAFRRIVPRARGLADAPRTFGTRNTKDERAATRYGWI